MTRKTEENTKKTITPPYYQDLYVAVLDSTSEIGNVTVPDVGYVEPPEDSPLQNLKGLEAEIERLLAR